MERAKLLARIRELRQKHLSRDDAPPDASRIVSELASAVRGLGLSVGNLPPIPKQLDFYSILQWYRPEYQRQRSELCGARQRAFHDALDLLESTLAESAPASPAAPQSGPAVTEPTPEPAQPAVIKRRRGPRAIHDPAADAKLIHNWQAAKRQGSSQKDFCKARGIKRQDLIGAQARQRERLSRAAQQNKRRSISRVKPR